MRVIMGVLVVLLLTACAADPIPIVEDEGIVNGDRVLVDYTGSFPEDGSVFDSSIDRQPLEVVVGSGQTISGFEVALIGMRVGESKNVTILPFEAYGERNESFVQRVDRSQFMDDASGIGVGDVVESSAVPWPLRVVDADEGSITVDMNHPLAGRTLRFEIIVRAVR